MIRFSSVYAPLLAGAVIVMSGVPSLSAPKTGIGGETDKCVEVCKDCKREGASPTSACNAACMDCYIRSVGPAQLAPAPQPADPTATRPLPAEKAR
jgi:hypothetical protein